MNLFTKTETDYKTVDAEELLSKLESGADVELLDVRSDGEHMSGHIPNSKNINVMSPDFASKISGLDKDKEYYVYCASGNRSKVACSQMVSIGFPKVYNLSMGMMGWIGDVQ